MHTDYRCKHLIIAAAIIGASACGTTTPHKSEAAAPLPESKNAKEWVECLTEDTSDSATTEALLFIGEQQKQALSKQAIAPYLVGLCLPSELAQRYQINEYLMTRGSVSSFYVERNLEELAQHLQDAGIELSFKLEALRKDRKLLTQLQQDNDLEKITPLMDNQFLLSDKALSLVPSIAKLNQQQREKALAIARRVRAHAVNANYFLSRGLYVSQKISVQASEKVKLSASQWLTQVKANQAGVLPSVTQSINAIKNLFAKNQHKPEKKFLSFVKNNSDAVVDTLGNTLALVKSFDNRLKKIPPLPDQALAADSERLNKSWSLPDSFTGQQAYQDSQDTTSAH
ncbi:MAG: hypothetical protein KTR20_07445 [Cellvibrionaceae bacterium]|nr:hypothetical protein [Cellvibrionaceae bacterium]